MYKYRAFKIKRKFLFWLLKQKSQPQIIETDFDSLMLMLSARPWSWPWIPAIKRFAPSFSHLNEEDPLRLLPWEPYAVLHTEEALHLLDVTLTNSFLIHRSAWPVIHLHLHTRSLEIRSTFPLSVHLYLWTKQEYHCRYHYNSSLHSLVILMGFNNLSFLSTHHIRQGKCGKV